jgi:hypothetical protein
MNVRTPGEANNEEVIRTLYSLAEGNSKDTSRFVSLFTDDGYFYDVGAGKKYFGPEIGLTVDIYAAAFPDMHREVYSLRGFGDHVLAELSLNGTHKGDMVIPRVRFPPPESKYTLLAATYSTSRMAKSSRFTVTSLSLFFWSNWESS